MQNIPKEILEEFKYLNVKNFIVQDYAYTSQLSANGDFSTYTGKELAVYRLAVLLSILEGSYLSDPKLGVNLIRYVFKRMTDDNISEIENELKVKIATYEKDLRMYRMEVKKDEVAKTLYFRLYLKYIPDEEDITLDFEFVKSMQALMMRTR